jgi:4-amino-4-deoxy-L-arabinose transferase-like glycosyltransferase
MRLSQLREAVDVEIDRLRDGLADPERGGRMLAATLAVYVALWTLYGAIAKANQDLHADMAEELVWAHNLALGYYKHPPLSAYLVRLWFSVVPRADWTFYLLAILVAAATLWAAWRLAGDYLPGEKRVLALALLTLVPFFNFHALIYSVNTLLMPLWAITTFWFLRSYRMRSLRYAALAGAGAAAAMLCKYWSVFLLAGLAMAALTDARRGGYFRSAAPWITVAAGLVVLGPHLVWLVQNDFAPLHYALYVHGDKPLASAAADALRYLAGAAAYVAVPVAMVLIAARPGRATLADMIWPADPDRRLAAVAFWGPLLLPPAAAVFGGIGLQSLWSMSAWALLPVMLLSPHGVTISAPAARWIVGIAVGLPLVMVLAAPGVAFFNHRGGNLPVTAQSRLLSAAVERAWHAVTDKPLRYVDGEVAYSIAVYAGEMPRPLPGLPPVPASTLRAAGRAMVCMAEDANCMNEAAALRRRWPDSRWSEVTLAREFFGIKGRARRYAILIVPPQP